MLTQSRLKEVLKYNKRTGEFTYRIYTGNKKPGDIAGGNLYRDRNDYPDSKIAKRISVEKKTYPGDKLAILYVEGYYPGRVYRVNNDISDDSYSNLTVLNPGKSSSKFGLGSRWKVKMNGIRFDVRYYKADSKWWVIKKVGNRIRKHKCLDTKDQAITVAGMMNFNQFNKCVKPEVI